MKNGKNKNKQNSFSVFRRSLNKYLKANMQSKLVEFIKIGEADGSLKPASLSVKQWSGIMELLYKDETDLKQKFSNLIKS